MIKSSSITRGALLQTYGGEHIQVDSIHSRTVGFQRDDDPCMTRSVRLCKCHGIVLTEEMFEKNGWSYDEINETWTHPECPYEFFSPWSKGGGFVLSCYNSIELRYVHQMQMALHLCGSHSLANHWKV